jgi:hypothetical protein
MVRWEEKQVLRKAQMFVREKPPDEKGKSISILDLASYGSSLCAECVARLRGR